MDLIRSEIVCDTLGWQQISLMELLEPSCSVNQ